MTQRTVLALSGSDRLDFLQGLVTNNVTRAEGSIVYTALLTPQGKLITDFFVIGEAERFLLDVPAETAPVLAQRLSMYKLRADVALSKTDLIVSRGLGTPPAGALMDPREGMGWRLYGHDDVSETVDWDARRVAHQVPEMGRDLDGESYILEMGFERLHGIDFKKGCYVGQEVTARMKHKTELKKGLARVSLSAPAPEGTPIMAGEKEAGTLLTVSGKDALAYLRFDRASGEMTAGEASVTLAH